MSRKYRSIVAIIGSFVIILVLCLSGANAREQPEVKVVAQKIAANLYLLVDSGGMGNTTVLTGEDSVLMVDTKIQTSVDTLLEKIHELSAKPIRYAILTHWHFDHVGGSEKVAASGAAIIAHENVRKCMSVEHDMKVLNAKVPPAPVNARPVLTYAKEINFHLNGENIKVFHIEPGHTDGDSVVYYQQANVIHMGDLYFEGIYPYIGIYSGGSINGMIDAINRILPMIDENTKVVPGHGPLSNKAKLQDYLFMLTTVRDNVDRLMKQGNNMEAVIAAKPTNAFDDKWGKGFLPPDRFAGLVYMDLSPDLP